MQKSSQIAQSLSELMQVEQFQGVSEQFSKELVKVRVFFVDYSNENLKKNI